MKKTVTKRPSKRGARPPFDPISKPASPPGHPLTRARPEDRAHPAERKTKHKRRPGESD